MASSPEIQEIKDKIDIADLVGEYLRLVPAGTGIFKVSCPFHNEKTPSMIISPARQSFHCFGCGAGGDIFEFLMKMENISFSEALKILAERAGVKLSRQNKEALDKKSRLHDACEWAARYWQKIFLDSPRAQVARDYLAGRGLTDETIANFRIGYAVNEWSNLYDFLRKRGFNDQEIFAAGFTIKKDRGSGYYDRFRHRIMFPIIDANGRICGFTGRTLDANEPAKYVNSPQTEIYNKSAIVFALYQAKNEIKKRGNVVIVEGQMDAVSCHQYGFANTVASSGTALTAEQLTLIKRYTKNIYFALDADRAGRQATDRGHGLINDLNTVVVENKDRFGRSSFFIDPILSHNLELKIISIPSGKDPDECLKNNPDDWRQAIAQALAPMEFYWQTLTAGRDINDLAVKKEAAATLAEKIFRIDDPIERGYWIKVIADRLSIREEDLREKISKLEISAKTPLKKAETPPASEAPAASETSETIAFRKLLGLIWAQPALLMKLPEKLLPEMLADNRLRGIYKDLILFYTKNNELFTISNAAEREEQSIFDRFYSLVNQPAADRSALSILEQSYLLAQRDFFALEPKEAKIELDNLTKLLISSYLRHRIAGLQTEMEQAEHRGDKTAAAAIYEELIKLIKQKSAV